MGGGDNEYGNGLVASSRQSQDSPTHATPSAKWNYNLTIEYKHILAALIDSEQLCFNAQQHLFWNYNLLAVTKQQIGMKCF